MAMGRPPKPAALKIMEGNPGQRRIKPEPKPETGTPTCPLWLEGEARREWKRVVPELVRLNLMTRVDRSALAAYCQSWARWMEAEKAITAQGLTVEVCALDRDGNSVVLRCSVRPEVTVSQKERMLMKSFLTEFGLTPVSRTRLASDAYATTGDSLNAILA